VLLWQDFEKQRWPVPFQHAESSSRMSLEGDKNEKN
jgi:hypothetical protein